MRVIPAIDLHQGRCVRLHKGNFDKVTEYGDVPASVVRRYAELRLADLHVVDLDGARSGEQANIDAIRQIVRTTPVRIQLGGGIRYAAVVEHWFDIGVSRCIVGSLAVQDPSKVKSWVRRYGDDRIVLALDVRIGADGVPMLATEGWTVTSRTSLWDCLDDFVESGVRHVLCTDIDRDGAMSGPNVVLYSDIVRRYPDIELQASGGVRNVADLHALANSGIPAAITGRALLDGKITAEEIGAFRRGE